MCIFQVGGERANFWSVVAGLSFHPLSRENSAEGGGGGGGGQGQSKSKEDECGQVRG